MPDLHLQPAVAPAAPARRAAQGVHITTVSELMDAIGGDNARVYGPETIPTIDELSKHQPETMNVMTLLDYLLNPQRRTPNKDTTSIEDIDDIEDVRVDAIRAVFAHVPNVLVRCQQQSMYPLHDFIVTSRRRMITEHIIAKVSVDCQPSRFCGGEHCDDACFEVLLIPSSDLLL